MTSQSEPNVFLSDDILREGLMQYYEDGSIIVNMEIWHDDDGTQVSGLQHNYDVDNARHILSSNGIQPKNNHSNVKRHPLDDGNDRWTLVYQHAVGYSGKQTPRTVINQMSNDLVGKMSELNVEKGCIAFGYDFVGKLQVTNPGTEHLINADDSGAFGLSHDGEVGSWQYSWQS